MSCCLPTTRKMRGCNENIKQYWLALILSSSDECGSSLQSYIATLLSSDLVGFGTRDYEVLSGWGQALRDADHQGCRMVQISIPVLWEQLVWEDGQCRVVTVAGTPEACLSSSFSFTQEEESSVPAPLLFLLVSLPPTNFLNWVPHLMWSESELLSSASFVRNISFLIF